MGMCFCLFINSLIELCFTDLTTEFCKCRLFDILVVISVSSDLMADILLFDL